MNNIKKTNTKRRKKGKKQKRAFTLIELLAVIIIIGILLIIAVPSVTRYINGSRNSSYVTTVKQFINGARNMVNSGEYEMYDTDTTYYIDTRCIKTENANRSPYGEFEKSYVLVTYDGKGYTYYWTGVDSKRKGTKDILRNDYLVEEEIKTNVKKEDIIENAGINDDSKYVLIDENCAKGEPHTDTQYISGVSGTNIVLILSRLNNKSFWYYNDIVELYADVQGLDDCEYDLVFEYSLNDQEDWKVVDNQSWIASKPDRYHLNYYLNNETTTYSFRFEAKNIRRKTN